jgi:hypothetical protein
VESRLDVVAKSAMSSPSRRVIRVQGKARDCRNTGCNSLYFAVVQRRHARGGHVEMEKTSLIQRTEYHGPDGPFRF